MKALELMLSVKDSHGTNEGCKCGIASNHRARQVNEDDFRRLDVMLAFDEGNVRGLNETFKPNDGTTRLRVFIK